jgi:hypothetical protein
MDVTLLTSQLDISLLKFDSKNKYDISVTLLTSHLLISPVNLDE